MLAAVSRSVRGKVMAVALATALAALLVTAGALLAYETAVFRRALVDDLATQADILARATAPTLAFDDAEAARADLALLEGRQTIRAAALYTADGRLFATYSDNPAEEVIPPEPHVRPYLVQGGDILLFHPVMEGGERLGTLYLRGTSDLADRVQDYALILGAVTAASLLIATLLATWLQATVTRPITALTDAARRVVQSRDFSQRVAKTTDDEIGILVDAFNTMVAEVGQRAAALEAADRRKDEFLATLAHELRNPLAPMVNALTIMERPDADAALVRRAREMMDRQLRQMVRLVDDLLDVSRITTGKLVIHRRHVELADVIRSAVDTVRPLIETRRHELSLSLPPQPVKVDADATRLAQVFANLLNNAAKYTEPGGRIALTASVADGTVEVRVSDNGIGIRADMLPAIFEMFTQADQSIERAQTGLGVGLSLAKRLVELHGGTIEAESPGLGEGSTFIVRLPALGAERALQSSTGRQAAPSSVRRRILLVDDNVDYAASLAILLESAGHEVRVAADAHEALRVAAEYRPDVALLDIGLPGVNGYDLARSLRDSPGTAHTVLVAVTGWGQEKDRRRAAEAGFDHHLVKPVELAAIDAVLGALVPRQAEGRARSTDHLAT